MKGPLSKKTTKASPSAGGDQRHAEQFSWYKKACELDEDFHNFDKTLHERTSRVINTLAGGLKEGAFSFDLLKEVAKCLLEMNQEVVKVISKCKEDICKTGQLFELVNEYFNNSLETLRFYNALEECLRRARDKQSLIRVALQLFEEETEVRGSRYVKTLKELENFEAAGDPFTEEFFGMFQSVYERNKLMRDKLKQQQNKLDKKLKRIKVWRRVSSMIFVTTCAALLICSAVAAAMAAAPPLIAALAAVSATIPIGSMVGEWVDSFWNGCENELKRQEEVISSMRKGNIAAITDLDTIQGMIETLKNDIKALQQNADSATKEGHLKIRMENIEKMLMRFKDNAEDLEAQVVLCRRHIIHARNVVVQRIMESSNN